MRRWLPLITICLGTFMLLIDVTIVNVALPAMALDLSTSFSSLQWVIDVYALVLAALLLGAGSLSDIFGRRLLYVSGLAVFALASLASGAAQNPTELILARGVQGLGAAAMFATTVALINASYVGRERGVAYGVWGAVSGAGAATGPIVGGLLTEHLSWRWIFFVNLPISVVAIVLALAVLDGSRGEHQARPDPIGLISFTGFAAVLTFAFIRAGDDGWVTGSTLALIGVGLAALAVFIVAERTVAEPMLDLSLFAGRRFVGVMIVALTLPLAAYSYLAYASIWLQSVLALSPIQAGLVFLPLSLAAFTVSAGIGRKLHDTDPRWIIGIGMFFVGAGALAQAVLGAGSRWPSLLIGLFLAGIGVGLVTPTMTSAVMSSVPVHRGGMAAGALNTGRQLGFAFGIAVLGTVFQSRVASALSGHPGLGSTRVATAVSGGQAQQILTTVPSAQRQAATSAIHSAFASGLDTIFIVSGLIALAAGVSTIVLLRPSRPTSIRVAPAAEPVAS
jgi:EmrB/QacA subfamily drug resistance transporter